VPVSGPADPAAIFELSQLWQRTAGQDLWVRVFRHKGGARVQEEIRLPPAHFEFGDTIIATTDPANPSKLADLPDDPRYPGTQGDVFVYHERLQRLAGQMMTYRVRRADGDTAELLVPPAYHVTLGARMQIGPVAALRESSPGVKAGVQKGDILQEVELSTADDSARERFIISPPKKAQGQDETPRLVDPVRLPDELRQWANAHEQAGVKAQLTVLRNDPETHAERQPKVLPAADWEFAWRFDREVPVGLSSPLPIPELGVAYRVRTTVEEVTGPPASAPGGLRKGDAVKAVRFRQAGPQLGESEEGRWTDLEPDQWAHVFYILQVVEFKEVSLRVERDGQTQEVTLTAQPDGTWPLAERGLLLRVMKVEQKADGIVEAVQMGLQDTWRGLTEVYLFLRGIIMQRLSVKNLGGPITIARVAYRFAHMDIYEFLFFLGMISINLAAFNFLPIPVLDGGHMVFLIYEKLRGKPASEQVQWGATLVGLVVLGTLMISVIILDILKL
jgi:regulator of sigma E protease